VLCASSLMSPAVTMATPGSCLRFGSLEFGPRTAAVQLQAIYFGSLDFFIDDTSTLRRFAEKEVAALVTATSLLSPKGSPHAHCMAVADVYPEDGAFTNCSEDEGDRPEHRCCMVQFGENPPANTRGATDHTSDNVLPLTPAPPTRMTPSFSPRETLRSTGVSSSSAFEPKASV
jgi:hypothetical protein